MFSQHVQRLPHKDSLLKSLLQLAVQVQAGASDAHTKEPGNAH